MQKWQYKIVTQETKKLLKGERTLDAISETLNNLGQEGWELVSLAPLSTTQGLDLGGLNLTGFHAACALLGEVQLNESVHICVQAPVGVS